MKTIEQVIEKCEEEIAWADAACGWWSPPEENPEAYAQGYKSGVYSILLFCEEND